jgi:fucose permease
VSEGHAAAEKRTADQALRLRRWAVTAVFVPLGAAEGTWAARVPAVKAGLHLSAGQLGLALLGPALGCVLAMPAVGAILASMAPRRVVQVGLVLVGGLLPVTTVAGSNWQLFLVLTGWGAGIGMVDVGMNTEAADVQDQIGRRVMSTFHAAYSVGGLAGAGLGAIAAAAGVSARTTFIIAGIAIGVIGLTSSTAFAARPTHHAASQQAAGQRKRRLPRWSWTLLALGAMSFASFLGEGSASNWSAVYLHSSLGASPALAAIGFTVFSATMTVGRLSGDWLADRAGPVRLVRLFAGLAAAGFGAALLIGHVWSGLVGFGLLGGGLSVIVPLAFTAAAGLGQAGPNLAFVTSAGYLGSLAGPPLIGALADLTSLPAALGVVAVLSGMIVLLAGTVRPAASPTARAAVSPGPPTDAR